MTTAERIAMFKMTDTQHMRNIKDLRGQTVTPLKWNESAYTDADGTLHAVLAIEFEGLGVYRTEVGAFMDRFRKYAECFADCAESGEKYPAIVITGATSKRGNPYINFELAEG